MSKKMKKNGKINLGVLVNSMPALNHLMTQPVKAKAGYRLNVLASEISKHLEAYNKVRLPVFEKYAKGAKEMPTSRMDKYFKELEPVLEEEIELNIPNIHIEDLGSAEISAIQLQNLEWLIEE